MPGAPFESSFEFVEHTADIAVRLRGPTEAALFEAAASAFTESLTDRPGVVPASVRRLALAGGELDLLLVDWLEELLYLFETEGFLVRETEVQIARATSVPTDGITKNTKSTKNTKREQEEPLLTVNSPERNSSGLPLRDLRALGDLRDEYVISATLRGDTRDPARHPLKLLIKGVTYHGLHIVQTEHGYEATVIFDI